MSDFHLALTWKGQRIEAVGDTFDEAAKRIKDASARQPRVRAENLRGIVGTPNPHATLQALLDAFPPDRCGSQQDGACIWKTCSCRIVWQAAVTIHDLLPE